MFSTENTQTKEKIHPEWPNSTNISNTVLPKPGLDTNSEKALLDLGNPSMEIRIRNGKSFSSLKA